VKIAARVAGVLIGLLVLLVVAQQIAAESGEVVVLTTHDAEGRPHETRLWVVDHEGSAWLRAGADVQAWYGRLLERPEVEVERAGSRRPFTAVPRPDEHETMNRLMREKYGWADRFISLLFGRDASVPIRLDPR